VANRPSATSLDSLRVRDWTPRAQRVNEKDRDLRTRFAVRDRDDESRRDWDIAAEEFKAELEAFYTPISAALSLVRGGDRRAVDHLLDFLEADPCR
jgi:hypothetical protein